MRLESVPVTLFSVVMGLCGVTLALRAGETAAGLTDLASGAAHLLTLAVFVVVALAYAAKALRHPQAVAVERRNCYPAVVAVQIPWRVSSTVVAVVPRRWMSRRKRPFPLICRDCTRRTSRPRCLQ